jgi:hypothetical protein
MNLQITDILNLVIIGLITNSWLRQSDTRAFLLGLLTFALSIMQSAAQYVPIPYRSSNPEDDSIDWNQLSAQNSNAAALTVLLIFVQIVVVVFLIRFMRKSPTPATSSINLAARADDLQRQNDREYTETIRKLRSLREKKLITDNEYDQQYHTLTDENTRQRQNVKKLQPLDARIRYLQMFEALRLLSTRSVIDQAQHEKFQNELLEAFFNKRAG